METKIWLSDIQIARAAKMFRFLGVINYGRRLIAGIERTRFGATSPGWILGYSPPRQNTCRSNTIDEPGAMMRRRIGKIPTSIREQSGCAVAAAGERGFGRRYTRGWRGIGDAGALASGLGQQRPDLTPC